MLADLVETRVEECLVVRIALDVLEHHPRPALLDPADRLLDRETGARRPRGIQAHRHVARVVLDKLSGQGARQLDQARQREQRMTGQLMLDQERLAIEALPESERIDPQQRRALDRRGGSSGHVESPSCVSARDRSRDRRVRVRRPQRSSGISETSRSPGARPVPKTIVAIVRRPGHSRLIIACCASAHESIQPTPGRPWRRRTCSISSKKPGEKAAYSSSKAILNANPPAAVMKLHLSASGRSSRKSPRNISRPRACAAVAAETKNSRSASLHARAL